MEQNNDVGLTTPPRLQVDTDAIQPQSYFSIKLCTTGMRLIVQCSCHNQYMIETGRPDSLNLLDSCLICDIVNGEKTYRDSDNKN